MHLGALDQGVSVGDWGRLGQLMLNDGLWGGTQVLPPGWLKRRHPVNPGRRRPRLRCPGLAHWRPAGRPMQGWRQGSVAFYRLSATTGNQRAGIRPAQANAICRRGGTGAWRSEIKEESSALGGHGGHSRSYAHLPVRPGGACVKFPVSFLTQLSCY